MANDAINNLSPHLGALITTGGNLAGGILNVGSQLLTNHWNNKQQWEMWHANNSYNHPASQMQRYLEAGLNPNLIYGQSNTAQPVNVGVAQPPNFDFLAQAANDSLDAYYTREHSFWDKLLKSAKYAIDNWDGYVKQFTSQNAVDISDNEKKISDNQVEISDFEVKKIKAEVDKAIKEAEGQDIDNGIKRLEKVATENELKFDIHNSILELFPDMGPGMRLFVSGLLTILEFIGAPVQSILSGLFKKK